MQTFPIAKSLDKSKTDSEIANGCNAVNFCSWERLKPFLEQAAGNKVLGVRAGKDGLEIIVE
jgi:hypothetical protein